MKTNFYPFAFIAIACLFSSCNDATVHELSLQRHALIEDTLRLSAKIMKIEDEYEENGCDKILGEDGQAEGPSTHETGTNLPDIPSMEDEEKKKECELLAQEENKLQGELEQKTQILQIVEANLNEGGIEPDTPGPPCPPEGECDFSNLEQILISSKIIDFEVLFFDPNGEIVENKSVFEKASENSGFGRYIFDESLHGQLRMRVKKTSKLFENPITYEIGVFMGPKPDEL